MTAALEELISDYRRHASEHGAATQAGNHVAANRHHDEIIAALHGLRRAGAACPLALLTRLDDADASVRAWAGTHCLQIDETRARRTLEALAASAGTSRSARRSC